MISAWGVTLTFAILLTAIFANMGFNRPSWSRSFTTFSRYNAALATQIALYVLLLLASFELLLQVQASAVSADASLRERLVWIALAFTLCLRGIRPFAQGLRMRLHRMAGIPDHAMRLGQALANADVAPNDKVAEQAKALLAARSIDSSSDWLPIARPLLVQMHRTTCLFLHLRDCNNRSRMSGFVQEAANELFRLRQRFDGLSFRVSRTLSSIERLGEMKHLFAQDTASSGQLDEHLRQLISSMIADACEDVGLFYRDACLLAARGVLATEWTIRSREAAIRQLGFKLDEHESRSVYRVFPYAGALLFFGLWILFHILPPQGAVAVTMIQRIVIIVVIMLGAFAIAILPKLHYGFANGGLRMRTPWRFIVAAGVCASVLAVCINLAAGMLIFGGWTGAIRRLIEGRPYLPAVFLTASTIAWLIQDHRWRFEHAAIARRLRDGCVLGLVWASSSLLSQWASGVAPGSAPTSGLVGMLTGSFLFGVALGALIPEAVRSKRLVSAAAASVAALPNLVVQRLSRIVSSGAAHASSTEDTAL